MPKVTGPLLSITASGTVAGLLCFRHTKAGPVVQKKPAGHNSRSQWQGLERDSMQAAAAAWRTLDPRIKTIWGNNSLPTSRSAYMSFFMEWKVQQVQPGDLPLIPSIYIGVPPRD